MKAVVLVGGFGTRLRPLTLSTPKQMLPVVDRPMIEHVAAHLVSAGIDELVLSLGYRPEPFLEAYPDDRCAGGRLIYAVEPSPMDTAGAIRFAATAAGIDERFVVVNGDVLTDLAIGELLALHDARGAEATIALTPVDDPSRYGVVPIDEAGRVEGFIEKPPAGEAPTNWINAGTYVFEPSVLARIPEGRPVSVERETFPQLVDDRTLFALRSDAYWIDTGTPESYLAAQLDLVSGRRGGAWPAIAADVALGGDVVVDDAVVMSGARLGAKAVVRRSLVLPDATIGEGACVEDSIVGPGAVVGDGAKLTAMCVIGTDAVVPPNTVWKGERMPSEAS